MPTIPAILLITGLLAALFAHQHKSGAIISAWLFLAFLIFSTVLYIADSLSGNGFDESVIYHLQSGLSGAGVGDFSGAIAIALALLCGSMLLAYIAYRIIKKSGSRRRHRKRFSDGRAECRSGKKNTADKNDY